MEEPRGPDLVGLATPELYRRNAFRLSGLPVDASARQVRRRTEEVEAALRLGAELTVGDAWLPPTTVDGDAVREALHRLRDPVRRIVDEFFWLWPGLGGDTLPEAEMTWDEHVEAEPPDPTARAIARHNRAIVSHLKVLESPPRRPASTAERWRLAYANWRLVLGDDTCWRYLTDRVAALGDPRLRPGVVERLRRELPDLLLSIHARLTVAAVIDKSWDKTPWHGTQVSWHLAAMRESRLSSAEVDQALVSAVEPHISRLRALSERATSATAVLSESVDDWRVVQLVLGDGHTVAAGVADSLASCVRECVVREVNSLSTADENALPRMREAVQSLDEAHRLAVGKHVRATIVRTPARRSPTWWSHNARSPRGPGGSLPNMGSSGKAS